MVYRHFNKPIARMIEAPAPGVISGPSAGVSEICGWQPSVGAADVRIGRTVHKRGPPREEAQNCHSGVFVLCGAPDQGRSYSSGIANGQS
jgi:hypothetical protein